MKRWSLRAATVASAALFLLSACGGSGGGGGGGLILPPKVACPSAPTRSMRTLTSLVGEMRSPSAETSSGPLEKNQTGFVRSTAMLRAMKRRAAGCQRLA